MTDSRRSAGRPLHEHPLDDELAALLVGLPALDPADPAIARRRSAETLAAAPPPDLHGLRIHDRLVGGESGNPPVPVRIFEPSDRAELLPGVIYFHGGGFVFGSLDGAYVRPSMMAREIPC